jgi:hypothetical protein
MQLGEKLHTFVLPLKRGFLFFQVAFVQRSGFSLIPLEL